MDVKRRLQARSLEVAPGAGDRQGTTNETLTKLRTGHFEMFVQR